MAFNPLAAIGTGLARGAGNYSQIMLADRLKKEAEARDLAARQQLQAEDRAFRLDLFNRGEQSADKRYERGLKDKRKEETRERRRSLITAGMPYGLKWEPGDTVETYQAKLADAAGTARADELQRKNTEFQWKEEEHRLDKARADLDISIKNLQLEAAKSYNPEDAKVVENVRLAGQTLGGELDAINDQISEMMEISPLGQPTGELKAGVTQEEYDAAIRRRDEIVSAMTGLSKRITQIVGLPVEEELNLSDIGGPSPRGASGSW